MKKILLLMLCIALTFSLCLSVSAEEVSEDVTEEVVEDETIASIIYGFCAEHSGEIFSALSFLGAFILSVLYKKGLLPAVNKSVDLLANSLKAGITEAKKMAEDTDGNLNKFMESIQPTIEKLEGIPAVVKQMYEKNAQLEEELKKATTEREILAKALKSESRMFYELFMSSNLPQYQKDKVSREKAEIDHLIEVLENENADEVRNP